MSKLWKVIRADFEFLSCFKKIFAMLQREEN
jgi:hypothetical protein